MFLNENIWISLKISMKFVPKVRINNILALVQMMAWRRPGDKPSIIWTSDCSFTDTRPQWVKMLCRECYCYFSCISWGFLCWCICNILIYVLILYAQWCITGEIATDIMTGYGIGVILSYQIFIQPYMVAAGYLCCVSDGDRAMMGHSTYLPLDKMPCHFAFIPHFIWVTICIF